MIIEKGLKVYSPGRINLIGEHLDYNGGMVLPAAIDLRIELTFIKNNSQIASIWSLDYDKVFTIDLKNIEHTENQWENYILGVLYYLNKAMPNAIEGFDCSIMSKLPIGSGISSSAALQCGIAKGVNRLFNLSLSDDELIKISRDAEHFFVGTHTGIMDQVAVTKGIKDSLLLLDCRTQEYTEIPADFFPYEILLLNTNVSHNLSTSEYNLRREECEQSLLLIQSKFPKYKYLAEVPISILLRFEYQMEKHLFKRTRYVIEENYRVKKAVKFLKKNNLTSFGRLLYQSHQGLKNLYHVSCPELDFLVDFSKDKEFVVGSRMMGGGFGGCTLNLVHKDFSKEYIDAISNAYSKKFNINLTPITVSIGNGIMIEESL